MSAPVAITDYPLNRALYDSGSVAAGAAIDSGVLDSSAFPNLTISVINSDGAATRALTVTLLATDGSTTWATISPTAVPAASTSTFGLGVTAAAAGLTAAYSHNVPPKIRFQVAANGASNGRVIVWGR